MTRMRLDHLSELLIASDRTQLGVSQPLPGRTLLFQVIQKTFRTGDQWPILSVRPQAHVDAIEITFSRDARESGDHQLNQARVGFVLSQCLDWRRNQRVVSDENVEIRSVIDAPGAESSQTIKRHSWTTAERTMPPRH